MKTPRRRERDETRVFKKMGEALGGNPGDNAETSSVKVSGPMDELERKKKNTREDRRVEQTKSGFLAQSGSGWAESQAKGEKRPVVKIDSGK